MKNIIDLKRNLIDIKNTPVILIFSEKIIENLITFKDTLNFRAEEIFYPIKVNNDTKVIRLLNKVGCGFEVGALSEVELLHNEGVNMGAVLYGNPIKSIDSIKKSHVIGIRRFCADHTNELIKLSKHAPKSEVYFRISINNFGAEWDLTRKFGCHFDDIPFLYENAINLGLNPIGISFHIGWNNDCIETWKSVFDTITKKIEFLKTSNIVFKTINIGGGYPSHNKDQNLLLSNISDVIGFNIQKWRKDGIGVIAEPGSFLLANTGFLVVSVIECIKRDNINWVYVDSGIFQGFYWILSGLKYSIFSTIQDDTEEMVVSGPTCDSHDVYSYHVMLPKSIKTGDKLIISPAGAYISSAKNYNGFGYPLQIIK